MVTTDSVLQDRYRVEEKIATGGMGSVYVATDTKLERKVAVKVLADNLAGDDSFVERFRREARAVAAIAHPKIANVFDYGEEGDCPFIVMELVEGRDLAQVLREEGAIDPQRTAHIVRQICSALGHAHSAGIIHRDVKPANVIVGTSDEVKVTDFGIARAVGDSKLTLTGSVLGTAHYISPEQASGETLGPRADLYSLGVVMFEMLTGAPPYDGGSLMSIAMRHINERVPAPSTVQPGVPAHLNAVVLKATEKDPQARFRDASEMAAALEGAADPRPVMAGVVAPTTPLPTAPLGAETQTVWPIPGDRWDPTRLGRRVLLFFGVLGVIALLLLVSRIAGSGDEPQKASGRAGAAQSPETGDDGGQEERPIVGEIDPDIIGMDLGYVEGVLKERGLPYEVDYLAGDELTDFIDQAGIETDNAEAGEVVGTDPPPGGSIREGEAITLFVSEGLDDEEDHPEGGKPDKDEEKGKGHDKDEEKDDD